MRITLRTVLIVTSLLSIFTTIYSSEENDTLIDRRLRNISGELFGLSGCQSYAISNKNSRRVLESGQSLRILFLKKLSRAIRRRNKRIRKRNKRRRRIIKNFFSNIFDFIKNIIVKPKFKASNTKIEIKQEFDLSEGARNDHVKQTLQNSLKQKSVVGVVKCNIDRKSKFKYNSEIKELISNYLKIWKACTINKIKKVNMDKLSKPGMDSHKIKMMMDYNLFLCSKYDPRIRRKRMKSTSSSFSYQYSESYTSEESHSWDFEQFWSYKSSSSSNYEEF